MTAGGRQRKLPRVDSMTAIASEPEVPFASGTGPRTVARDPRKLALSDRWRQCSVFWRKALRCRVPQPPGSLSTIWADVLARHTE